MPFLAVLIIAVATIQLQAAILLSTDFETNPVLSGWTNSGPGASWTTAEHFSGSASIQAQTAVWSTRFVETAPLQWYRLSFKSKAPGTVSNLGSIGYAYWSALFYDASGNQLSDDQYSSILQSSGWVTNEFRIRAKTSAGPNGTPLPGRMKISFQPIGSQPFYVDDVIIENTTPQEVARWADLFYNGIPAKLNYRPKANRWSRIPRTLQKLRQRQTLRVVMLGDSVQQDTANAPIDVFLERQYPGSRVEMISSTKGGTGVSFYRANVSQYITSYRPDLLVIGGISNGENMADFQSIVDQVRASDAALGRTTEILLLTKAWSPNAVQGTAYFFAPAIRELDQELANNTSIPNDYRGALLRFANSNQLEYLDLTGISSEFVYGPAAAAGLGPPVGSGGHPYSYWLRDLIHGNQYGKQILGREFEAYFSPVADPVRNPTLYVQQAGANVTVSWSALAPGYVLHSASSVTGSGWSDLPGQNLASIAASGNQRFFRLRRAQ